jgi:hypothetical protein
MTKKYDLLSDHKAIKEQILDWEKRIDKVVSHLDEYGQIAGMDFSDLEEISHEMTAINI